MRNWLWKRFKLLLFKKQAGLIFLLALGMSLFISSVGLFLYSDYRDTLDKEINQPHTELLQINLDVTNRAMREADEQAVNVSFHPAALRYISAGPGSKKEEAASGLFAFLNSLTFHEDIQSVYVIDLNNKQLMSSRNQTGYSWESSPDQTWIQWVDAMKTKPLLIKRRVLGFDGTPGQPELISLYRPIIVDSQVVGLVIANMDYDRFFSKIYSQIKIPQFIFSLDGELIYPKLNLPVQLEDMVKAVEQLDVRPFADVELEGRAYLANQAFSDMTGWRWVSLVPLEDLLKNAWLVRNMVMILSLISILVGCAAIYYYNYASFRPLKRIRELIARNGHMPTGANLHDLEVVIQKLMKDFDVKTSVADQSLPELRAKYIQDVLMRRIGSKETRSKWDTYFREWTDEPLLAAVVSISRYKEWSSMLSDEDQFLLKYALTNIILETLDTRWRSIIVALHKENLLLIVQSKASGIGHDLLAFSDFGKIIGAAAEYLRMELSVGIGEPCRSVSEMHSSFTEAQRALSYRLYNPYGTVILYADIEQAEDAIPFVQGHWKKEWTQAVESADEQVYLQTLERWSQWIENQRVDPEAVYAFVDDLIIDLTDRMNILKIPKPSALEDYTEHQLRMMNLEDVKQLLLQAVAWVSRHLKERKSTKEYHFVQRVTQFMEQHLQDNIGLQEIADYMELSTSSLSSTFKQETGRTVYEYLTEMRIERACSLLTATDNKVADIATQVGYQNENSFIRSFRKLKMVTPGKYRERNRMQGS